MSTAEQRVKEVLSTLPDTEIVTFMLLLGAQDALSDNGALVALRGTFASHDMKPGELSEVITTLYANYEVLSRSVGSLLDTLEGLLEEFHSTEENKNSD